jgi:hypothetical protein
MCVFKGTIGRVNRVMREVNQGVGYTDQCTYTFQKKLGSRFSLNGSRIIGDPFWIVTVSNRHIYYWTRVQFI